MDEFDCGAQYLCELTAIQASNKDIQDPLVLALQQVKMARSVHYFHTHLNLCQDVGPGKVYNFFREGNLHHYKRNRP